MRTEYLLEPEEKVERYGPGIWTDEPDEAEWVHEETGLPCLVLRNLELGNFCGYVGVHQTHPWHGADLDAIEVDVHGGLSFGGLYEDTGVTRRQPANVLSPARSVTLSARPDESYLGWRFIGFDCAHAGDLMPQLRKLIPRHAAQPLLLASRPLIPWAPPGYDEGLAGAERMRILKALEDPMSRYLIDLYRDFVWVRRECEQLAEQAAKARGPRT